MSEVSLYDELIYVFAKYLPSNSELPHISEINSSLLPISNIVVGKRICLLFAESSGVCVPVLKMIEATGLGDPMK